MLGSCTRMEVGSLCIGSILLVWDLTADCKIPTSASTCQSTVAFTNRRRGGRMDCRLSEALTTGGALPVFLLIRSIQWYARRPT